MFSELSRSLSPWSVSKAKLASTCALAFRYRYIEHLPEQVTSPETRVGTAAHEVLERVERGAQGWDTSRERSEPPRTVGVGVARRRCPQGVLPASFMRRYHVVSREGPMSAKVITVKGRRLEKVHAELANHVQGGRQLILNFGRDANPERILATVAFLHSQYEVELVVRHAELREYIEHTVAGAAIGASVGAGAAVLAALAAGNPVTVGPVLVMAGIGALVGALVGAGATAVQSVTVYKHNGETRLKVAASA